MLIGDRAASEPRGPNHRSPDQEPRFAPQRLIHRPRHGSLSVAAGQTAPTPRRDSREVHHAFSPTCPLAYASADRPTSGSGCEPATEPVPHHTSGPGVAVRGLRSRVSGATSTTTRTPGQAGRRSPTDAGGPAALATCDAAAGPGPSGHAEAHAPATLTVRVGPTVSPPTRLPGPVRVCCHLDAAAHPRAHPHGRTVALAAPAAGRVVRRA